VKIGVVSDTHGFFDTRLDELLAGVELILHAGDVGKQEVLGELQRIAPVRAVRGNVDPSQLGFPFSMTLNLGGTPSGSSPESSLFKVELFHELSIPQAELEKWGSQASVEGDAARGRDTFLRGFDFSTRVIVFGHSHVPCAVALGGKLFFNPGSAGKQRFSLPRSCGVLEVSARGVEATILSLQRYNRKLPDKVWLTVGGRRRCGSS
jgi:hypothetical protein